jgi:hypothetical protein
MEQEEHSGEHSGEHSEQVGTTSQEQQHLRPMACLAALGRISNSLEHPKKKQRSLRMYVLSLKMSLR